MAQLKPGNQRQDPSRIHSDVDGQHHVNVEEKQATTHDFLSRYGDCASSNGAIGKNGSQSGVTTQNLLQPLQTNMSPVSSISVPTSFVYGGTKPQNGNTVRSAGEQHTANTLISGRVDMEANCRSLDVSYASRPHVAHVVSTKHWQQQQNQISFKVLDGNKRLARGFLEDDDDEDDNLPDHDNITKEEICSQKLDNVQQQKQQLEGKSLDNKGLTPRSKHSATEQRRRSKINDRFQRLRQLLPYSDQKRDKASFLLEVIEYIQRLHEKVKRYETMERLSQPQEGGKTVLWDGKSGRKEGLVNVSHGPLAAMLRYGVKGTTEANGYKAYQSSSLRVSHENANIDPNSISGGAVLNRLLQEAVYLPSYEDNPVVSSPMVLGFTAPINNSTEEQASPTLFLSGSQSFPGGRTTMPAQILHHEDQAARRAKSSLFIKEEASVAQSHLQQTGKTMALKVRSFSHDPDHEQSKSAELSRLMLCNRAHNEEVNEQLRSSPVKHFFSMRESEDTEYKASHDLDTEDDKLIRTTLQTLKGDCIEKSLVGDKRPSAVLGGVINISSPYSQGRLDTLTRALHISGIDLTQASISVQIDLGKSSVSPLTSYKETAMLNTSTMPGQSSSAEELKCQAKKPKVESEV